MHVGQLSEAGADAVNDRALLTISSTTLREHADRLLGRGCDLDGLMGESNLGDFRER